MPLVDQANGTERQWTVRAVVTQELVLLRGLPLFAVRCVLSFHIMYPQIRKTTEGEVVESFLELAKAKEERYVMEGTGHLEVRDTTRSQKQVPTEQYRRIEGGGWVPV